MFRVNGLLKIIALGIFTAFIASCSLPQQNLGNAPVAGKGTVNLSIAGTGARTIFPDGINSLVYSVNCAAAGEDSVSATLANGSGSIQLKSGVEWSITITATDPNNSDTPVGTYTITVTLSDGQTATYNDIYLQPVSGSGALDWSVSFPDDVTLSGATLYYSGNGVSDSIDLLANAKDTLSLASGSYVFRVLLVGQDSRTAGTTEAVHIYSGMTTTLDWAFTAADFAVTMDVPVSAVINASDAVTVTGVTLKSADYPDVAGVNNGGTWSFLVPGVSLEDYNLKGLWLEIQTANNVVSTDPVTYAISSTNDVTLDPVGIYALTLSDCDNGTLGMAVAGNSTVLAAAVQADLLAGASVTVTATPADGWAFNEFTATGITAGTVNPWTFTMPGNDVTIGATFTMSAFSVNLSGFTANTEGSVAIQVNGVDATDPIAANMGDTITLTATPETGYEFDSFDVSGVTATQDGNTLTFTLPANAVSISVNFKLIDYTITVSVDSAMGSVQVNGVDYAAPVTAHMGDAITILAAPLTDYTFVKFTVDGTDYTDNPYTFTMPAGNVAVSAAFKQEGSVLFNVKVDADFSGFPASIALSKSAADSTVIALNASDSFTSTAWYVDGGLAGSDATYTLSAADWLIGSHNLAVVVGLDNGLQYSKTVSFTVTR